MSAFPGDSMLHRLAISLAATVAQMPPAAELKGHTALVYSIAFSPDGKLLASGGADGLIKVWDVVAQKELKVLKGQDKAVTGKPPEEAVTGLVFTPDNASVLSIGFDRYLHVWTVASGVEAKKLG